MEALLKSVTHRWQAFLESSLQAWFRKMVPDCFHWEDTYRIG